MAALETIYGVLTTDAAIVAALGQAEWGGPAVYREWRPPLEGSQPTPYLTYRGTTYTRDPWPSRETELTLDFWDLGDGNDPTAVDAAARAVLEALDWTTLTDPDDGPFRLRLTSDGEVPDEPGIIHRQQLYRVVYIDLPLAGTA